MDQRLAFELDYTSSLFDDLNLLYPQNDVHLVERKILFYQFLFHSILQHF